MNILQSSKVFLRRNASTILTCVGGVGVVATSVLSVKATPKAMTLLKNAEEEKGEELTKFEKFKVAGPAYIPAVITGVSTIACIFGANVLNKRHQAALMSAYALLDNSYKEYRAKVEELYGEDADKQVREEIAKDKYEDQKHNFDGEKRLFYDEYSERYFESTTEQVLKAEYEINRMLATNYGVYLNEFYDLLDIDTVDYGDYIGWSIYEINENYCYGWIEFRHTKAILPDGLECTIVSILTDPTFDFENY